jgi:pyruvate dehydrogenase E1 component
MTLGTDGFGRSDTRARLRRFFEVDAESTVIGTLFALAEKGLVERGIVAKAIKDLDVDPEKIQPQLV